MKRRPLGGPGTNDFLGFPLEVKRQAKTTVCFLCVWLEFGKPDKHRRANSGACAKSHPLHDSERQAKANIFQVFHYDEDNSFRSFSLRLHFHCYPLLLLTASGRALRKPRHYTAQLQKLSHSLGWSTAHRMIRIMALF